MLEGDKNTPMLKGPIEFDFSVEIDKPACDVFPLVDVSDPRFAQVALGNTIKKVGDTSYHLEVAGLEDYTFLLQIIEHVPNERHAFKCVIEPKIGNLVEAVEDYELTPVGDNSCVLTLVTKATFSDDLSVEEIAQEVTMMSIAVENNLAKLKMHAELGVEAVKAYNEEEKAAFEMELDLDGFDIDWDDIEPEQ